MGEFNHFNCPVGLGCRKYRLLLCRGVRAPLPNEYPEYDTKQFESKVPVLLELYGMWSTHLLPLLPGPLWPGMVAHDWTLSMGKIERNCILIQSSIFLIITI